MQIKATVTEEFQEERSFPQTMNVCGVFSEGIYIEGKNADILLLHDTKCGSLPFGIGIFRIREFLQEALIEKDDEVILETSALRFLRQNIEIQFITEPAKEICQRIPTGNEIQVAVKKGCMFLDSSGKESIAQRLLGLSEHRKNLFFSAHKEAVVEDLKTDLKNRDSYRISSSLKQLLGLGIGLTPSMDDFLCGMLYTLGFARQYWRRELPELFLFAEAVYKMAPQKTCVFSVPYLRAAAQGRRISVLDDVLDMKKELLHEEKVKKLLQIGNSSGAEMLAGVLYGLMYLQEE